MTRTSRTIQVMALSVCFMALRAEADNKDFIKPPQYVGVPLAPHAVTNRAFQGIPSMAVSRGGRLWATWYAGVTPGEDHNNYVVLSTSGDNGATWQEVLIVDPDGAGPVRAYDPELWLAPDSKLYWAWAQAIGHEGTVAGVWFLDIDNPDSAEPKWSKPVRITDGVMMCKPVVLSTGEWALPASTWRATDNSARMVVSTDHGRTWNLRGGCNVPLQARSFDEHMFVERKDGSLWLLVRTKYGIGESISTDRGKTWPELKPSTIPHPSARFFITRLNSGNLLLVKHGPMTERTGRSHLTAFISIDDGKSWSGGLLLDESTGVSYPDGQQTADGLIRIIYDYSRTGDRHILMATFREEDIAAGKDVSGAVKLRQLVSQASGGRDKSKPATADNNNGDLMQGFVHPPVVFNPGKEYATGINPRIAAGQKSAEQHEPAAKPWSENSGERLYNGIVLPEKWPPREINPKDDSPMPVPYLDHPPKVIPIDVGRQLFVDNFLIESGSLNRVFHLPVKYEGNPVLKPETALERPATNNAAATPKSGGVWWDPAEKIFKMWYEAGWLNTICYATSRDGLSWDRPLLDVRPGSNQVLPLDLKPDSWTVVPDWDAKDPRQRYTMRMQPPGKTQPGLCMTSADGIHWTNRVWSGDAGDRSTHFYNPFRKKWVHSIRSAFRGRSRHYWESDDFLGKAVWQPGEPAVWAAADRDDLPDPEIGNRTQLYNLDAVAYESLMLGMFELHRGPENDKCMKMGLPKITELSFAYSRDGFHWYRPDRRAHIPAERRDVWDRGYVQSIGNICTIHGDKLWIYYTGYQGDTNRLSGSMMRNGMYHQGATGVAFLRRDGFASMDADGEPGTLTTRPVIFSGKYFFVNAKTPKGALRAEIRDADGKPIAPFTLDNSVPFAGDSTIEPMRWKAGNDLSVIVGRPVRFHFEMTSGSLYAFWVSKDESGRSDGYVAGGGPGYTGPTDTVGRSGPTDGVSKNP